MSVSNIDVRKKWQAGSSEKDCVIIAAAHITWESMHRTFKDECQQRLDEYADLDDVSRAVLILDYYTSIIDVIKKKLA